MKGTISAWMGGLEGKLKGLKLEFYIERKKERRPCETAWMELESIMLSEISQAVRNKYLMILPLTGT